MRTYLVIPDAENGGTYFEHLCRALTPQEACEHVSEYLGYELAVFYELQDTTPTPDHWLVRELPFMLNDRGVVGWERFPSYVFKLGEHPDAEHEGIESESFGCHTAAPGCHE